MSWLADLLTKLVTGTVTAIKLLSGASSAPLATKPPLTDDELGWKPARDDEDPTSGPKKVAK
jgi:hypothetical protein